MYWGGGSVGGRGAGSRRGLKTPSTGCRKYGHIQVFGWKKEEKARESDDQKTA